MTRKQLLSDLEEELGLEFKDNTEKLKQIDGALKENRRKVNEVLDNIDGRHRDILNQRLDRLKVERQFLEEEKERLISQKRKVDVQEVLNEILQYLNNADEVLAGGTPQEKKTYIRQFVAGIKILPKKKEGIIRFYAFPRIDEALNQLGKSRASVNLLAEGGICTFAETLHKAKILKRFSCQTGATLEMIRVNQGG